jgi:hypothetical protein
MPMTWRCLLGLEITAARLARARGNTRELSKQQRQCDEHDLRRARHADFQYEAYHDSGIADAHWVSWPRLPQEERQMDRAGDLSDALLRR